MTFVFVSSSAPKQECNVRDGGDTMVPWEAPPRSPKQLIAQGPAETEMEAGTDLRLTASHFTGCRHSTLVNCCYTQGNYACLRDLECAFEASTPFSILSTKIVNAITCARYLQQEMAILHVFFLQVHLKNLQGNQP